MTKTQPETQLEEPSLKYFSQISIDEQKIKLINFFELVVERDGEEREGRKGKEGKRGFGFAM